MKSSYLIIYLLFAFTCVSSAQSWPQQWERQSNNRLQDYFTDIAETKDGSYVVLGATGSGSKADLWVLKFNNKGDTVWTRKVGTELTDIPLKIVCTNNNDVLILGQSGTGESNTTMLVRMDENGTEKWRKILDKGYVGNAITALDDNGFMLAGGKGSDSENQHIWLAKINESGETVWEKTYEDAEKGCVASIRQLPNGEFVLGSQVQGKVQNDCDMLVIRVNKEGQQIWASQIDSPNSKEWPECICCSPDSCFVVVGWNGNCLNDISSEYPVFDFDLVIKKMDCDGKVLWSKNVDSEGSEGGNAVTIRPDGDFIVAGTKVTSFAGNIGPWLLHIDPNGNILDELLLDMKLEQASKVINTSDGGFVVIGPGLTERTNPRSDGWIIKFAGL